MSGSLRLGLMDLAIKYSFFFLPFIPFLLRERCLFKILNWQLYTKKIPTVPETHDVFLELTYLPILCKGTEGDDDSR